MILERMIISGRDITTFHILNRCPTKSKINILIWPKKETQLVGFCCWCKFKGIVVGVSQTKVEEDGVSQTKVEEDGDNQIKAVEEDGDNQNKEAGANDPSWKSHH